MEAYVYSAGVTVAACVLMMVLVFRAGLARGAGGVKVLETYNTTNEKFIIATRIHLNTLENLALFIPLLWVATVYSWASVAAGVGVVWLLARIAFAYLYTKDPKTRAPAFVASFFSLVGLVGLSLYGLLISFV